MRKCRRRMEPAWSNDLHITGVQRSIYIIYLAYGTRYPTRLLGQAHTRPLVSSAAMIRSGLLVRHKCPPTKIRFSNENLSRRTRDGMIPYGSIADSFFQRALNLR
jgi:hypothetical protein